MKEKWAAAPQAASVSLEFRDCLPPGLTVARGERAVRWTALSAPVLSPSHLKNVFTPLVTGNVPKMYIISWMGEHQFHRT